VRKDEYAPFEVQYNFNNDVVMKMEASRFGEFKIRKHRKTTRDPKLLTRGQWRDQGREVIVADSEAARVLFIKNTGRNLQLFSEDQTETL
jgi:hypothetical protein